MKYKLLWSLYLIPNLLVVFLCWVTNFIACIFTKKMDITEYSKRYGSVITLKREQPIWLFSLWNTHDNPVDEAWYGLYDVTFLNNVTQEQYDKYWIIRYWCRLWWLSRNTAYGWTYLLFSLPKDRGFQYKAQKEIDFFGYKYNDINIGWKAHTGIERLSYACRFIGLRKTTK